jgi:hypothetical protein
VREHEGGRRKAEGGRQKAEGGKRNREPGTRNQELGTRNPELGTRKSKRSGTWNWSFAKWHKTFVFVAEPQRKIRTYVNLGRILQNSSYQVKAINHAVLDMGRILLGLTSEAVAHTNPPDGHPRFVNGRYWIEDIKARDALIGFFRDGQGEPYAMVVNQLHGMNRSSKETTDSVMLTFGSAVKSVEAVNWLDGKTGMIQLKEGRASLTIAGGTGVLLRASLEKH